MPIGFEELEGVCCKPVIIVTVEYHGVVVRDTQLSHQLLEILGWYEVSNPRVP
jgi:hypothetical protein